jgi:hypothetical protein
VKKDKVLVALEAVHSALRPLKPDDRQRVLLSVRNLLEVSTVGADTPRPKSLSDVPVSSASTKESAPGALPRTSIRELIQDKRPGSHPELITLFAYYREKYEDTPHFARADLQRYYGLSKENPPKNYDRDFSNAVKRLWIVEDGDRSYVSSRGIEAVESNFASGSGGQALVGRPNKTKKRKP